MEHENATMIAPRIQWIGVFAHELSGLGIEKEKLLPITPIDYKKALSMMHRPDHRMPKYWKTELTNMLHSRRKAEIEIICSASATVVFNEPNSGDFDDVIDLDGCDDVHLQPPSAELRTGTELLITYLLYKINACHQEHVMVE
ncbi:endodeoxyribonuclease [Tulasnella sp. 419]|nr:endodeoxyribonuclease [Tulasnella sp. 419]